MAQPATGGSSVNHDLASILKVETSLQAIVGHTTGDGTGVSVDLKGYEGAAVAFSIGISGDTLSGSTYMTLSVEDSPSGIGSWAGLDASQYVLKQGAALVIDDPAEDDTVVVLGLLPGTGLDRYVRAKIAFTGTHTVGTAVAATVIKGFARVHPATM